MSIAKPWRSSKKTLRMATTTTTTAWTWKGAACQAQEAEGEEEGEEDDEEEEFFMSKRRRQQGQVEVEEERERMHWQMPLNPQSPTTTTTTTHHSSSSSWWWSKRRPRRRHYYGMLLGFFIGLLWLVDFRVVSNQQLEFQQQQERGESRRQAAVVDHYVGGGDDFLLDEDDNDDDNDPEYYECDYDIFQEYFSVQYDLSTTVTMHLSSSSSSPVPFSFSCLRQLIGQYPTDMSLRTAHVRKMYAHSLAAKSASTSTNKPPQTLLYHCTFGSGGLGDRFWGAALTLYLALALNVPLAIHFQHPLPLDAYVEPVGLELPSMKSFLQQYTSKNWLHDYQYPPEHPTFDWKEFARQELPQWKLRQQEEQEEEKEAEDKDNDGNDKDDWSWWRRPWQRWQLSVQELHLDKDTFTNDAFRTMNLHEYFFGASQKRVSLLSMLQPPLIARHSAPEALFQNAQVQQMQRRYLLDDLTMEQWMTIFLNLYARRPSAYLSQWEAPFQSHDNDDEDEEEAFVVGVQMRLGGSQNVTTLGSDTSWEDPRRYFHGDPVACFAQEAQRQCELGTRGEEQQEGEQQQQQEQVGSNDNDDTGSTTTRRTSKTNNKRKKCRVLVSSDSSTALQRLEEELSRHEYIDVWQVPGEITHIDKVVLSEEESNQREAHARAFVDWHLLAYHTHVQLVSRSGFGELAALASAAENAQRAWHYDNHETSCKFASMEHAMNLWHQRQRNNAAEAPGEGRWRKKQ